MYLGLLKVKSGKTEYSIQRKQKTVTTSKNLKNAGKTPKRVTISKML